MTTTNNLGITLVEQSQAQKEITINEAFTRLDSILNNGAKSKSTNTPPASPASGDLYIVGSSPTGAWSGKAGQITYYDQIWRFIVPKEGVSLWVNDEDVFYNYNGTSWVTPSGSGTVTSVAVTTANGVSGTVSNATSSPAISLTLGAITPSSVAATGSVTGSNLSGTNTGDQTITLTGDITGSGTGSFATAIGANRVTNSMLAGSIDLTSKVTGILPIANGGTGQSSATNAINALLPTQTGNNGRVLSTNGTSTSWIAASGSGTVTSVAVSGSNGIGISGSPITASGTIALSLGAITPSSVAATGSVTGSNLSGTNTGDQTITLTGDITGTGTGSFATTIGASKVTNSMLAGSIDLTSKVTGILPIANGGTGQSSATNAINALLPTQTGNSGRVLSTNGTSTSWIAASGSGTVTSVAVTTANGVSGTVSNATSSPAISLTLGAITPSSVAATGSVTGSNLSGTNTGDQTITLTGDITGSGTGSFATTIGASKVTNSMLAGSIDLTSKVTGILPAVNGGTANGFTAFSGPASSTKTFTLPNSNDSIACLGQANAFTRQQYFSQSTLTDGASIAWNLDSNQAAMVTLGGNRTLSNPTNQQAGASYTLIVKQDGTGSRTLAYGTAYKWPAGTAPVLSTAAASVDILTFISDGTNMFGVAQKGFA